MNYEAKAAATQIVQQAEVIKRHLSSKERAAQSIRRLRQTGLTFPQIAALAGAKTSDVTRLYRSLYG